MAFMEAQKALMVAKYIRTETLTVTQRFFRTTMHKIPLSPDFILRCHKRLLQDGNMEHIGGNERSRVSDQNV